jgi:two-component system sensor histidine kinase ChvG
MPTRSSSTSITTPASAIAGLPAEIARPAAAARLPPRRQWAWRSLGVKAALLACVFLIVPIILYTQFRAADSEKQNLLLRSVREQGRIMSQALLPVLAAADRPALGQVGQELARFADEVTNVRLVFKPANAAGFFYIASWPPVPASHLDIERDKLAQQGVLDQLAESCQGELPVALRYSVPSGDDEIVTSLTPLQTPSGCWAVITSFSASAVPGSNLGVPYYARTEVRIAAAVYLAMALLTLTTFWSVRRGLRHFGERARAIRERGSSAGPFAAQNEIPELAEVADEFDRMVDVLSSSAQDIRRAAEDNAHAFKTPIAVIRQSLEPLKRQVAADNQRGMRAIGLIESSLDKLDGLVASARRLDEATADLIETRRTPLDVSHLLERLLNAHADVFARKKLTLKGHIAPGVVVLANEEMVETVAENLLDNAISFSPEGESLGIRLETRENEVELLVGDAGPGVPEENLARIFDRYFSERPPEHREDEHHGTHFGIGLWVARRNVEAMGGTITAENRRPHGLLVRVRFPLGLAQRLPPFPAKVAGPRS